MWLVCGWCVVGVLAVYYWCVDTVIMSLTYCGQDVITLEDSTVEYLFFLTKGSVEMYFVRTACLALVPGPAFSACANPCVLLWMLSVTCAQGVLVEYVPV